MFLFVQKLMLSSSNLSEVVLLDLLCKLYVIKNYCTEEDRLGVQRFIVFLIQYVEKF